MEIHRWTFDVTHDERWVTTRTKKKNNLAIPIEKTVNWNSSQGQLPLNCLLIALFKQQQLPIRNECLPKNIFEPTNYLSICNLRRNKKWKIFPVKVKKLNSADSDPANFPSAWRFFSFTWKNLSVSDRQINNIKTISNGNFNFSILEMHKISNFTIHQNFLLLTFNFCECLLKFQRRLISVLVWYAWEGRALKLECNLCEND